MKGFVCEESRSMVQKQKQMGKTIAHHALCHEELKQCHEQGHKQDGRLHQQAEA